MSRHVSEAVDELAGLFYRLETTPGRRVGGASPPTGRPRRAEAPPSPGGPDPRTGYRSSGGAEAGGGGGRATLGRTLRGSTEVVVKISGAGRNLGQIRRHLDYIARRDRADEVPLEDGRGNVHDGPDGTREAIRPWTSTLVRPVPERGEGRRESLNLVLSMPPATEREAVHRAAHAFGADVFGRRFPYVLAVHRDTGHPHVHLIVRTSAADGGRLDPRKADLHRWRQRFAAHVRAEGLEANATYRDVRGVSERSVSRELYHLRQAAARHAARRAAAGGREAPAPTRPARHAAATDPAVAAQLARREAVLRGYAAMATVLDRGDAHQREEAGRVRAFMASLPPIGAGRDERRASPTAVQSAAARSRSVDRDEERER